MSNTDHQPTRRSALALLGLGGAAACAPTVERASSDAPLASGAFEHGVASGDPLATAVILWTRVTPANSTAPIDVEYDIDTDPAFTNPVTDRVTARAARDYTVKIDATALTPGTEYYYRFRTGSDVSVTGRTKTLAASGLDPVRMAVVTCSNFEHGYFNAYDLVARRAAEDAFDVMLHLGDYYYEYGANVYNMPGKPVERIHEPAHEIVTLDDYRIRHAQYRRDPNLQAATAAMPMIAIWDDHETANDSWRGGAENHDEDQGEGTWTERRQAALRAYYDWMPVREPEPGRTREQAYRSYAFGDLISMVAVETRLTARAEPLVLEEYTAEIKADPAGFRAKYLDDPNREMLGAEQRDFIVDTFADSKSSGTPWRMLANQVMMARVATPNFGDYIDPAAIATIEKDWPAVHDFLDLAQFALPFYPDSWDGYPAARERFFAALDDAGINDMIVLTGDAHEAWASNLTRDDGTRMGAEFVSTSVTSKTLVAYLGENTAQHNLLLTRENEDPKYYNALYNGFTEIEVHPKRAEVTLWAVDNVASRDYGAFKSAGFTITKRRVDGRDSVRIGRPRGLNLLQRALFSGLA